MSPNPYGNVSSRKDRAKWSELYTLAAKLRDAATLLKQSASTLEAAGRELTAAEHLYRNDQKSIRERMRLEARPKARKMEWKAREKAREALRLISKDLEGLAHNYLFRNRIYFLSSCVFVVLHGYPFCPWRETEATLPLASSGIPSAPTLPRPGTPSGRNTG